MFTERQSEIITGSLLGDGTIATNFLAGSNCKFQVAQSELDNDKYDKRSYLAWFAYELCEFGCSLKKRVGKFRTPQSPEKIDRTVYTFYTLCSSIWNEVEKKWYVPRTDHHFFKRRKIVPQDILLTPLSLCVWMMDDGSNQPKDANIILNTQGFTPEEIDFLIERLNKDLSIKSKRKRTKKESQFRIYVGRKSYFDFIEIIKPHVKWDCFKYKIDTSAYIKVPNKGETHWNAKLTKPQVLSLFRLRDLGEKQSVIAEKIGCSKALVSNILSGNYWKELDMSRPTKHKPRLSEEKKKLILNMHSDNHSQKEIADHVGVNQSTVSRITKKGRQWNRVL